MAKKPEYKTYAQACEARGFTLEQMLRFNEGRKRGAKGLAAISLGRKMEQFFENKKRDKAKNK